MHSASRYLIDGSWKWNLHYINADTEFWNGLSVSLFQQYNFLVDFPAVLNEYRKNTLSQMVTSPSQGQETCNDDPIQSELPSQSESTNKEYLWQTAQQIVCPDHKVEGMA